MKKFKKFGAVALILVAIFAFSGITYSSPRNEGQLVYLKDITRATDTITSGEITATGDMKIQDIATGTERTVVKNLTVDPYVILNPTFTSDGKKILFTAGNTANNYKVYLVSSQVQTDLSSPPTALKEDATYNLRYASLSPNSDGATTGLLAYTKDISQTTGTHELWIYNFETKKSSMVVQEANKRLRHPVFLADSETIAYIGVVSGIQDIYTINVTTYVTANVTINGSPTPRYGRLVSNVNRSDASNQLIYSKQVSGTNSYEMFDIFVRNLAGSELNVTNTPLLDEFEPAFYGDATTTPLLTTSGDMFYSAKIVSEESIWQTNFSASSSNGIKFERTTEDTGLANWGKSIGIISDELAVALDETRFVYTNNSNEISRADVNSSGVASSTILQITSSAPGATIIKSNPSLSGNGGTILFDEPQTMKIQKVNHNGSGGKTIAKIDNSYNLKQPNISSDGRWAVYVRDGDLKAMYLVDSTLTEIDLGLNLTDAYNPSFNPEMTQIVYSRDNGMSGSSIYMVKVTIDLTINNITAGTPERLTNEGANIQDRYPSFSPDGKYIIFTSNRWDGNTAIYAMKSGKEGLSGSGITRIVASGSLSTTNPFALFGPVNTDPNNYYVAYVNTSNGIQIATLSKDFSSSALYGESLVSTSGFSATGITPTGKFSWARRRETGSIFAERIIQTKAVKDSEIEYYIKVDVDEASVPNAYIIEETFPGWTLPNGVTQDILIDGTAANASGTYFISGNPTADENTLRIVFSGVNTPPNDKPQDHLIKIIVKAETNSNDGDLQNITGTVTYNGLIEDIRGNNTLILGNPYCPFDIYNSEGALRTDADTGIIENLDLLYGIDCWARDVRLQGHKGLWPLDLSNYDGIILETINIWATKGGELGEYEFLAIPTVDEMYWKSGIWVD